jgi:Zn-dependent protease
VRRFSVRLGRVLGIELRLHASWFLVFGLVVWATTTEFGELYPRRSTAMHVAMGLVTGLAFFVCLTAHELAHSAVARRFDVQVRSITLFLFGGVAEIRGELRTPATEFAVALVGPAVSILLGGAFGLAAERAEGVVAGVLLTLALVNLGVGVFNLVPGLPLDGGRLLRAGLWRLTGSYARATRVAAAGGRVVAALLVALGGVLAATGEPVGLWYVPMGVFLWLLAGTAGRGGGPVARRALALGHREGEAPQPGP